LNEHRRKCINFVEIGGKFVNFEEIGEYALRIIVLGDGRPLFCGENVN